jgi:hypothetical protein
MADELRGLANLVSGAVDGAAWSGDGRQAAVRASGDVPKVIWTAADHAARFAQQIATAAMNYGQAEAVFTNMVNQTADASGRSGGSGGSASDPHRAADDRPITENN